jgi:hypothetical protein
MRAEEFDGWHDDHPGEYATGKNHTGDARSNNVTNAQIFRSYVRADRRARIPLGIVRRRSRPRGKKISVGKECVESAQTQSGKYAAGEGAAFVAGNQNVGAGCAFRI